MYRVLQYALTVEEQHKNENGESNISTHHFGSSGWTRTSDPLINSQML